MPTDRFEDALQKITYDFAMQVVQLIRTTTVEELVSLAQPAQPEVAQPEAQIKEPQPPTPEKPVKRRGRPPKAKTDARPTAAPAQPAKRRGRPPKKAVASTPVEAPKVVESAVVEPAPPARKAKKKRAWPICSIDGCGKNFYGPSGKKRLCYGHHLDAGGKQSPLVAAREKKPAKG